MPDLEGEMDHPDTFSLVNHGWHEGPNCFREVENIAVGYISEATEELGLLGMTYLFLKSYSNNKLMDITGLLYYDGRQYGMIVEGEKNNIHRLCKAIEGDLRHKIIYKNMIPHVDNKHFNNWTMKFKGAEAISRVLPVYRHALAEIGDGKAQSVKHLMSLYDV